MISIVKVASGLDHGSGDCNLLGYSMDEDGDTPVMYYLHKELV